MIDRYDFWTGPLSPRQMVNRCFQDAFVLPSNGHSTRASGGALDVYQEGDTLMVKAHLPGVDPNDVDVTVEQGILTIRGQTRAEDERKDRSYVIRDTARVASPGACACRTGWTSMGPRRR